jgi:hypothetical protein
MTDTPIPKFELPSGLTSGPWYYFEASGKVASDEYDIAELWYGAPEWKANGRAIASIPDMVQEIERLRNVIIQLDERSAMYERDAHRLREQYAELVEAAKPFVDWITSRDTDSATSGYPDVCTLTYSPNWPNEGAATVGDLRKLAAILAKAKAEEK